MNVMKRFVLLLMFLSLALGCQEKQGPLGSGSGNPLDECVIPEIVNAGGEGIIQWNGFTEEDDLVLSGSDGTEYDLSVSTVTGSGLIFKVPSDVPAGTYMLILVQGVRSELGEVKVLSPEMPVSGAEVPSAAFCGDAVSVSGMGFEDGCRIILINADSGSVFLEAFLTNDGISFDLPEDMVQGVYEIWLEQDGFSWLLDDSFEVLAVAVEKRLKAVRYYAPYIGASKIMTEWSISLDDPVSLTFSEYLVEGDELSLNAYDRYVCGEDGTFVLDYDGRESSNDIEITYTRDSEGKVTGSDVLIYGKKEATPFVWTYGTDGLLTDVSSPGLVYKTFEYEDGKMTGFGQVSFVYGDASLTNSPLAPDVIWGYMSVQDPDNPFLCFPYLLGWYSGTSVLLPEKIVMPSVTGTGAVTHEMSYEFDAEGYVVSMSWNNGGSEHWVEYLY